MSVISLDIQSRQSLAEGAEFGDTGGYEQLDGEAHFAVDPRHEANEAITDLDLAPTDNAGLVTFSARFRILKPIDPDRGNQRLLYEVVNRGNPTALRQFNDAVEPAGSHAGPMNPGNGFLMRQGYTVAWCGWQHDVPSAPGRMTIDVPEAGTVEGPISGNIAVTFQPNVTSQVQQVSDRLHRPYPADNLEDWNSVLTVRDNDYAPAQVIPRNQWSFGKLEAGKFVPDASHIFLAGGFQAGKVYQVIYSTSTAPIVGMGLLATRDLTSFLRYAEAGNPCDGAVRRAYAFGRSQSGRFLRVYLYHGLNRDEQDRTVFDGLIPLVAGGPARGVQLPFRSALAPFRLQREQSVPIHRR